VKRGLAALAALSLAWSAAARVDPVYRSLVERYARGQRAEAVAGLSALPRAHVAGLIRDVQKAPQDFPLLKAAAMLHVDRDESLRAPGLGTDEGEQPRHCPGADAGFAERYAALLALQDGGQDFAKRFYLAFALQCRWNGCLLEAQAWATKGLALFPRDAALLGTLGAALEEYATLSLGLGEGLTSVRRERRLREARRFYEQALAVEPDDVGVRVHLGRVLWRLGEPAAARQTLERAIRDANTRDPLYLAHLFLGRLEEDEGRLEPAVRQYRQALIADPMAQTAAIALSHALGASGDPDEARETVVRALANSRTRGGRDGYWRYLVADPARVRELFAALREETLR
jgi:tetratricopeptide (TPR) repeat protein